MRHLKRIMKPVLVSSLILTLILLAAGATSGGSRVQAAVNADWPMYLHDAGRSGYNPSETIINPTTAPNLALKWTATTKGCANSPTSPTTISVQPVVVQPLGRIFWGSWDGCEHATNLSGAEVWSTYLGQISSTNCAFPSTIGVASTPVALQESIAGVMTPVLLVGGGDAAFYALNANTGAIIWRTPLGTAQGDFIWSSPVFYRGSIYIGLSSQLDCPLITGELVKLNAISGAIQNIFHTTPTGCRGASVWGSPSIDTAAGTVYFATGNPSTGCQQPEPYAVSLIEVRWDTLKLVGSWQVPAAQQVADSDFGSTPTLFQATINGVSTPMVGLENKNGLYYAFARDNLPAGPVWQMVIGDGEIFSPSAWDGAHLYVAGGHANIAGTSCIGTNNQGSLSALDPATGSFIWQDCLTSGNAIPAVTAVPGLTVVEAGASLYVVNAASGQMLFTFHDTSGGAAFYGPATISNGVLYTGDSTGTLFAFGL